MIPASCGSPGREPRNPARDVGPEILILRSEAINEHRLLVPHDKRVEAEPHQHTVQKKALVAEQGRLAQDDGDKGNVNRIAHVAIETRHHEVLRRRDRRGRAQPLQRKARKRVDKSGQTGDDQQDPDGARRLDIEEGRPKLPMRDPPGNEPRQRAGRNRKEEDGAQYRDRFRHATSFPSCRKVNYLIAESRRPCESVSTRPIVQQIGHPRSATRAATPAPKDSQGCAVWWTMAQASSAAAAAPRIRCTPRKALPNMPTPRK